MTGSPIDPAVFAGLVEMTGGEMDFVDELVDTLEICTRLWREDHATYHGKRYSIDDAIMCGDQIVHRLTATGTMTGEFMGIAPTGKHAKWSEIHIGRGINGRLTEHWALVDQLSMLVQLGIVPAPGRVAVSV